MVGNECISNSHCWVDNFYVVFVLLCKAPICFHSYNISALSQNDDNNFGDSAWNLVCTGSQFSIPEREFEFYEVINRCVEIFFILHISFPYDVTSFLPLD